MRPVQVLRLNQQAWDSEIERGRLGVP